MLFCKFLFARSDFLIGERRGQSPKRGCNALKVGFFVPLWFENILR